MNTSRWCICVVLTSFAANLLAGCTAAPALGDGGPPHNWHLVINTDSSDPIEIGGFTSAVECQQLASQLIVQSETYRKSGGFEISCR